MPQPVGTCPECNTPLRTGQKFCTKCGYKLRAPGAAPPKGEDEVAGKVASAGLPTRNEPELPPQFRSIQVSHDKPLFSNLPEEQRPLAKRFQARNWVIAGIIVAAIYYFFFEVAALPAAIAELVIGFYMRRKGATRNGWIFLTVGVIMLILFVVGITASS